MTVELDQFDRCQIDLLIHELRRMNDRYDAILVSCQEAARLLSVTPPTISNMIRQGRLQKHTIGPSTGILLSDIRKLNSQ